MKLIIIFILTVSLSIFAKETHKSNQHREHSAHAHGAGSLGIAFEGVKGQIDFKIPSESIFGFEYVAKSEKDKKKRDEGLVKLETKISEMIVFDSTLNCKITKEKIEVVSESAKHSETNATFNVTCDKSPIGTEITFNFQKHFPGIKDLDVQVVADNVQKSIEATKGNEKLLLK